MLRATWKSLLARRLRLFMSAFAVMLGVAFVAGSLVFTDTLGRAFTSIMAGTVGDVVVRPAGGSGDESTQTTRTLPASLVGELAGVQGAARADGNVTNFATFVVGKDGKVIGAQGAPGIGLNYSDAPAGHGLTALEVDSGRVPQRAGEIALDPTTASKAGYRIGDDVRLVSSGAEPAITARLVGLVGFGNGGTAGASLATFDTDTAQQLFMGGKDTFTDIWVTAEEGTSQAALRDAVSKTLPAGFEAVTGDKAADEAASDVNEAVSFIGTFLLVFAGVALVVGSFLIVNTFSILVAQRSRELALFRALGANRRQVTRSVVLEAIAIGLVGSTVGLGLGFVLALGIKALFATFGLDLSGTALVFEPSTAVAAYAVGLLVTLVAAYLPARRAGRIAPMAALREDASAAESSIHRRVVFGTVLLVAGAAGMGLGLFSEVDNAVWWIGGGIFGVLIGTALTSPLVGRPVIALTGAFCRRAFGAVGVMAEQNAVRNPRRTAATASALMIGLTLVSMMAVVGQSAKASIDRTIDQSLAADYVVSNAVGVPFSPSVTDQIEQVPGVGAVARFRFAQWKVDGVGASVSAIDPAVFEKAYPIEMAEGRLADLTPDTVVLSDEWATSADARVGDTVEATLAGTTASFRVVGVYRVSPGIGSPFLASLSAFDRLGVTPADNLAFVVREPGADAAAVTAGITKVIADLPTVTLKDQAEFAAEQRGPIDQMLYMIYALLGLAVVIAVLGIINTLALSVIERTREIGLLRAVGLSRRQLRTMLRLESVVISLLGAALGVGLGVAFGIALQRALSSEGIDVLSVPVGQLAVFVGFAGVVGVLAAVWPGRRAARLDVLKAITTE